MQLQYYVIGIEIDMLGSILETKSMVLESIILPMDTVMKDHGMKGASKVMACILSATVR